MRDWTVPNEPYAPPAALDGILADLRDLGIRPTRFNVIRAAIERGSEEGFAAALASSVDNEEILAPLAMAEHQAERRGEHRR